MRSSHSKQASSLNQYFVTSLTQPPLIKLTDSSFQQPTESPKHLVVETYIKFNPKTSNNSSPTHGPKSTHAHTLASSPGSELPTKLIHSPMSLPLLEQRTSSISVYNALKEKQKGIFTTSPGTPKNFHISPTVSLSPKKSIRLVMTNKDFSGILNKSGLNDSSSQNLSPRRRLALQEGAPKKKTIKDVLIRSNSISLKKTSGSKSNSPKKGAMPSSPKKELIVIKRDKDITEMEDEEYTARAIYEQSQKTFSKRMDVYNKFYTAYLVDPEQEYKFNTKGDLKVKVEAFVTPKAAALRSQKTMTLSPSKPSDEYGGFGSFVDRILNNSITKTENSPKAQKTVAKLRSMNTFGDLGFELHRIEEKVNTMEQVFTEGIEDVESSTNELLSVQNLMQVTSLTRKEEVFLTKVKEGKYEAAHDILMENPHFVNIKDARNQTPLHWAVKRGHKDIAELLCKNDANIDAIDMVGRTPMDIAKRFAEFQMIQMLEFEKEAQEVRNKLRKRSSTRMF